MLERMENQMNYCMDAIRLQDRITQDQCENLVEIFMEESKTGYGGCLKSIFLQFFRYLC